MAVITDEKVLGWRREQLLQAGFPYDHAHALAVDSSIDLHEALDLAARAGHWLAWQILTPRIEDEDELARKDHLARLREYTGGEFA